jgi:translation initiation factor 2A
MYLLFRPAIQFSSDEATACRVPTNEVQFFDTGNFSKGVVCRLRVPGVASAELSISPASHVAAFVPESKVCAPQQSWRLS